MVTRRKTKKVMVMANKSCVLIDFEYFISSTIYCNKFNIKMLRLYFLPQKKPWPIIWPELGDSFRFVMPQRHFRQS